MQNDQISLQRNDTGNLAKQQSIRFVGDLERALLSEMPAADACDWDRTGMLVGDPADTIQKVAIALDPTIPALDAAYKAGANVLVTHHPVFLDPPIMFTPSSAQGHTSGAVVRFAIEHEMSILSFHTTLDVSQAGLDALPTLLRLRGVEVLEPLYEGSTKGFGRVCVPDEPGVENPSVKQSISLRHLSARCVSVFGVLPRVWGSLDRDVTTIVTSGGSAGSLIDACLDQGVECLICGEVKYHEALDASLSGLSLIELGHDVSEFPLCALLAAHCEAAGVEHKSITMIDQKNNWCTPESFRR